MSEKKRTEKLAREETRKVVGKARNMENWKEFLPPHLRCRLERKPGESATSRYRAEFLTVPEFKHFRLECKRIVMERIVGIVTYLKGWKECLPGHLIVRLLELDPSHSPSEFSSAKDVMQFHQDCDGFIREQAQRIIRAAWMGRASCCWRHS